MLKTVGNPSTRYGDQTIIDGDLVIGTAGKGIDFSATPGTGTSELLDDYEEGTWTPTLTTDGTDFDSVTYSSVTAARYTKVGNVVHIQGQLRTSSVNAASASGNVLIGNLPFAAIAHSAGTNNGSSPLSVGDVRGWAGEQPSALQIEGNSTTVYIEYRSAADGATSFTAVADVGTGANQNSIYFAGTYLSA
jgi:hypothetical protein